MALSRNVVVRLHGPPSRGDAFGMEWSVPENPSPGPAFVRARVVERKPNDVLRVRLDGEERDVTLDESLSAPLTWREPGNIQPSHVEQLRQIMVTLRNDPSPIVANAAESIIAEVTGNGALQQLQTLLTFAQDTQADPVARAVALAFARSLLAAEARR